MENQDTFLIEIWINTNQISKKIKAYTLNMDDAIKLAKEFNNLHDVNGIRITKIT